VHPAMKQIAPVDPATRAVRSERSAAPTVQAAAAGHNHHYHRYRYSLYI